MSFPTKHLSYGIHVPHLLRSNAAFYPALYGDVQFLPVSGNVPQQQQQAFMGLVNSPPRSAPATPTPPMDDSSLGKGNQGSGLSPSATTASPTTVADMSSPISSSSEEDQTANATRIDLRRQFCHQNVFVFHLPPDWNEDVLKSQFSEFGRIMSVKVVQRPDGSSKGYGFVCFYEPASAARAVEKMNDHCVGGKRLKVSLKKTPEECMNQEVDKLLHLSNSGQHIDPDHDCTLFVFHLPPHWTDEEMRKHFEKYGNLLSATVARKSDQSSRGYGFVKYENPREAALAITNLNGANVGSNKRLKVQLKQQTQQQHKPGRTVFVFHIPSDWTEATFRQHFSHYGKIVNVTIQRDAQGKNRGFGFISFDKPQSAANAIAGMNGFCVGQKRLKVAWKDGEERFHPSVNYNAAAPLGDLAYSQQATADGDPSGIGMDGRSPNGGIPHPAIAPSLSGFSPTATAPNWLSSNLGVDLVSAQLNAYHQAMAAAVMTPSAAAAAASYGGAPSVPDYANFGTIGTTPWNTIHAIQFQKALQDQQRDSIAGASSLNAPGKGVHSGARPRR